jgi:DNA modification methylase
VTYEEFVRAKKVSAPDAGVPVDPSDVNPRLKPFTRDIARWAIRGGRRAVFAAFGLHKTATQLEIMRLLAPHTADLRLIVLPLGVRQEFKRDAELYFQGDQAIKLKFIRRESEIEDERTIYLTNYESIREGILNLGRFGAASLDEASVLRGFGGTKTFREFMRLFEFNRKMKFRFVATATPSPNEYIELLAYAAFLEIMDVSQAKTRFFKRDSTKADHLTIHEHKKREFCLWLNTWAIFFTRPSDLGYPDDGYILPEMQIHWHELPSDNADAGNEPGGQGRLVRNVAIGVTHAAKEKRESLAARMEKLMELRALDPAAHRIIWHDLEIERRCIEIGTGATSVYGAQDLDKREQSVIDFSDGKIQELAGKPSMLGSGCNFQRHCAWSIFLGIGFKFNDFIQSCHRVFRFGQTKQVRLDLIYTEAERDVKRVLQEKWENHNKLVADMSAMIREFGLGRGALDAELSYSLGQERHEVEGENYRLILNDSVLETTSMPADSVHLILSSIPFGNQYSYSPSFNDFGHTDSPEHFWEQMGFLIPELYRVLQPGRACLIHVKDRITPGGLSGMGFQTAYPFHCDAIRHFQRGGFAYLGMKTIVTDVVRENNQTYRLGWTEQCKDGSRMGVGMPEYLLLFRKPPTDSSKGYADVPVVKDKTEYSRSRWQIDAHGFARSSGNRLLTRDEIRGMPHDRIYKRFRAMSLGYVYDFEQHVGLGEELEVCAHCGHIHIGVKDDDLGKVCGVSVSVQIQGMRLEQLESEHGPESSQPKGPALETCKCTRYESALPNKFMLLQPQSWHPDVWTDITRMLSLNSAQSAAGREMHLCPMQFDLADRAIAQFSMPGEVVLDPFSGLGTVPLRAIKQKRRGLGIELSPQYFRDACFYCEAMERKMATPSLFDLLDETNEEKQEVVA